LSSLTAARNEGQEDVDRFIQAIHGSAQDAEGAFIPIVTEVDTETWGTGKIVVDEEKERMEGVEGADKGYIRDGAR